MYTVGLDGSCHKKYEVQEQRARKRARVDVAGSRVPVRLRTEHAAPRRIKTVNMSYADIITCSI